MNIDITQFTKEAAPRDYSASVMEIGADAGPATWRAACEDAADYGPMLSTPDQLEAMRDHARGFGAWDDDEIAAWSDNELNALFIQLVAGDIREADFNNDPFTEEWWPAYGEAASAGQVTGNFWRDDSGAIFYSLED